MGMSGGIAGEREEPWREVTRGCGLLLHAPLPLRPDLAALRAELAILDAVLPAEERSCLQSPDGSWTSIALIDRARDAAAGGPGTPAPALRHMPSLRDWLSGTGWVVRGIHLMRLPPGGVLPWHYDNQALHLEESRLLLPLLAPEGAVTLIGDAAAAYPAGVPWTGDFTFPHQVENRSGHPRIVLVIDLPASPELRALLPPALAAEPERRRRLAAQAVGRLLAWRAGQAA